MDEDGWTLLIPDWEITVPYQRLGGLHPNHPGAVADHVTDLPERVVNQSDLLVGRRDGHDADWTERTMNY